MTTATIYTKRVGIVTGTNWSAPRFNLPFWHVLSGYIQSETLTLEDVELAFVDFKNTTQESVAISNAEAFIQWMRDYYERVNYAGHDPVNISEEVGLVPSAGKQLGIVEDSLWDTVPSIPTSFWHEMTKYINNESLSLNDVQMAHEDFLGDLDPNDDTEEIALAQAFCDWFTSHTITYCVSAEEGVSFLE